MVVAELLVVTGVDATRLVVAQVIVAELVVVTRVEANPMCRSLSGRRQASGRILS